MSNKKPGFGKRRSENVEPARKPSMMERLRKAGSRLWGKKDDGHTKKPARAKGFRR